MPFTRLVLAALLFALGGCGLANQTHSTSWTAALDHRPDAFCVINAIATLPEVARVQKEDGEKAQIILVALKGPSASLSGADIYVVFQHGQQEGFRLDYRGWARPGDLRAITAPRIIARLISDCAMPELAKAREHRDAEWNPYLFNI